MGSDIYEERILEHYKNPRNTGVPEQQDDYYVTEVENTSCGDTIDMYIKTEDKKIVDIRYEAEGCAISVASASILSEYLEDKSQNIVEELDQQKMTESVIKVDVTPMRLKCVLLPRDAVRNALDKIDN